MPDYYGNLPGAMAYHTDRRNLAWIESEDGAREGALIRASEALDGQYGKRFPGTPAAGRAQLLAWPRRGAVDYCSGEALPDDAVPAEVERATYALALIELQTPGAANPTFTPGAVNKREKVDAIERERFGPSDGVPFGLDAMRVQLAAVEDALRCLLLPKQGGSVCLLRV